MARGLVFAGLAQGGLVGSTHYHDSSPYGNHCALTSGPTWLYVPQIGRFGVSFDGDDDRVLATRNPPTTLSYFSYSFWAKFASTGGDKYGRIIDWSPAPCIYRYRNATLGFLGTIGSTRDGPISGDVAIGTDTWLHCAITYDGTAIDTWINGALWNHKTDWTGALAAPTNTWCLGGRSTDTDRCAKIDLADFLGYDRALSPAEIQQLADPSNTLLSGLILPPRRTLFSVSTLSIAEEYIYRKINYYRRLRSS